VSPGAERIFVGLGANLGDAAATVMAAAAELDRLPLTRRVALSSLWSSAPVDAAGPDFVNAVAELRSGLEPGALLAALLALERGFGRERPYHHAPRTLDLDLLLYGEQVIDSAGLKLPHPRMHVRAFVLRPLMELAPALVIPGRGPVERCLSAAAAQEIHRIAGRGQT
jgi:2-amino-4-hydroxy-6-hydroxymethyldihydropteridine diphosphokinase